MPRSPFLAAVLVAAGLLVATPPQPADALVNRASMAVTTSYLLRSQLNYGTGSITTFETISIRNISGSAISKLNLSVVPRAFGELTAIRNFRVDGRAVTARWTNNSNLELQLGRNLGHGQSAKVTLWFSVRAGSLITTSLDGRLSRANGIMQVGHWFPIVSDGHAVRQPGDSQHTRTARRIRLELTTNSSSVRVAIPGRRIYASGRTHIYELDYARDFAFGASPNYRVLTGSAAGVSIAVYYTTGDASAALVTVKAALVRYESAFGQYQWSRFVVAQTGRPGSGNEYPGIIFLGRPMFANREVVAHETAHQWWYGMVGNDQLREPWLDEGFAEFATAWFFGGFAPYESTRPVNSSVYEFPNQPAPLTSRLADSYDQTVYEFPNQPAPLTSRLADSYDQTVYFKAAGFLEELRAGMGTNEFFDAARALFAANRNGILTTRRFYDTFAEHGAPTEAMDRFLRL